MASPEVPPPERLELLYRAGLEFNSTLDPGRLLPQVLRRVIELLEAEAGSIWLREGERLRCAQASGPVAEGVEGVELPVGAGLVGAVARSGESELVADSRSDERSLRHADEATGSGARSVLVAPLTAGGEVLGVLQVVNKRTDEERGFDESDLTFLNGLAATAGLAVRNAQVHEAERRGPDLRTLLRVSRELTSASDSDRLALSAVDLGSQAIDCDRAAMAVDEGGRLELRAVSGRETLDPEGVERRRLLSLISWLLERDREVYVEDLEEEAELAGSLRDLFGEYLESRDVRSLHLVPLEDEQGRLGALYFESATPGFLGERGRDAAGLLAGQTSMALRNARLRGRGPFDRLLEPMANLRRRLASMSRRRLLTRVVAPAAVLLLLLLIPWGGRIEVHDALLRPGDRTPVRTEVPGVVASVEVAEGARVEEGQLLGRLRQDELDLRIQRVRADRAHARRALAAARSRGDEVAARLARIEEKRWTSVLEVLRRRREKTEIRAPISGRVLTHRPGEKVGEELRAGEALVVLGRTDRLELRGRVASAEIGRVEEGDSVRFKVPALPGETYATRLSEIAPYGDVTDRNPSTSFVVRALVRNDGGSLRPGMEAEARVVGQSRPVGYLLVRPLIDWVRTHWWR